jgi:hypothetical protein
VVDIDYHMVMEPPSIIIGGHMAYSSYFVIEQTDKQVVSNYTLSIAISFRTFRVNSN